MDYSRLLKQCKNEVALATSIEEAFLVVHEYYEYLMQLYSEEAEKCVEEENEEYYRHNGNPNWDGLPF